MSLHSSRRFLRRSPLTIIAAIFTAALVCQLAAGPVPKGCQVPEDSISPNHEIGVTVPILTDEKEQKDLKNNLIEIKTGKLLGVIKGETGWNRQNHGGVLPARWSKDSSILVWTVDGKWFPNTLVVLKLREKAVLWQVDLLKTVQREMLTRTKAAKPKEYAAIVAGHKGDGSAYPDGFSIDVDVDAEKALTLPLHFHGALTSDPKGADSLPKVESKLEGTIDEKGTVTISKFALGAGKSSHF